MIHADNENIAATCILFAEDMKTRERERREREDCPNYNSNGSTWNSCLTYLSSPVGVVGWCEGAVYLTSPGCPADIGLQLGKACYPCSG